MIVKFEGCARCHGEGHELDFRPFLRPIEVEGHRFSYWALCPETGEPILLSTTDREDGS